MQIQDINVEKTIHRLVVLLAFVLAFSAIMLVAYWAYTSNHPFDRALFFKAAAIGIFAQLVDGALGMAYGVTATTLLLSNGLPPAICTGAVHIAEIFTTGASGLSHLRMGNIKKTLFYKLLIPGSLGALAGVYLFTEIDGKSLRPWMSGYLFLMGLYIFYKAFRIIKLTTELANKGVIPLAFTGAFVDAVGGGGWGPVVTTGLLSSGHEPRTTIGSVNSAEFFITLVTGFSFALLVGVWHWEVVAGLILGGLFTAPIAARLVSLVPAKILMILVGILISCLSGWNLYKDLVP